MPYQSVCLYSLGEYNAIHGVIFGCLHVLLGGSQANQGEFKVACANRLAMSLHSFRSLFQAKSASKLTYKVEIVSLSEQKTSRNL